MLARKISAESASSAIQSGVVERSFAGFAPNSIGAKELFRHVLIGLGKASSSLAHAENGDRGRAVLGIRSVNVSNWAQIHTGPKGNCRR